MAYVTFPPYTGNVPNRDTDTRAEFNTNINYNLTYLSDFADNLNASGASIEALADSAVAAAAAAETASDAATASANYAGEWSSLTGAYNKGISVAHAGDIWLLLVDVVDITATEPAVGNSDWQAVTGTLGPSLSIDSASVTDLSPGTLRYFAGTHADAVAQDLPDLGAGASDPVHWEVFTHGTATRTVQQATQLLEVDGERGQTFINIKEGATWYGWQAMAGGSTGPTYPAKDFGIDSGCTDLADWTELDPNYNNPGPHYEIEFTLDCSLHNYWLGYTNEAPSTGSAANLYECDLVFNITNLPDTANEGVVGFLEWRSLAEGSDPSEPTRPRQNIVTPVFEVPSGWTFEWAGQVGAPTFGSTSTETDIIQIKALQGVKVVQASLVGVRRD